MSLRIVLIISANSLVVGWTLHTTPRQVDMNLTVDDGGPYGEWLRPAFCASGTFAVGYYRKIEADQGNGDSSFLNSVSLHCRGLKSEYGGDIQSGEGPWGYWTTLRKCTEPEQFIVGFELLVRSQEVGDYGAAIDILFKCGDTQEPPSTDLGSKSCPLNSAICGIEAKMEVPQGDGDDSALNDVKLFCCHF